MSEFDLDTFSENMLKKLNRRLDWDEYHMACAVLVGSRSNCERLHVGCVLVKNQRLVSAGYNGFLPSAPHKSCVRDGHEQATVHAEQNAIADAASRGAMVKDATAYVTHRPCINCAKILAASGIREIIYLYDYGSGKELVKTILDGAKISLKRLIQMSPGHPNAGCWMPYGP